MGEGEPTAMTPEEIERALLDLLAIIHRDGGHYTGRYGLRKSVRDAMRIVPELRVERNREDDLDALVSRLKNKRRTENERGAED